MKNKTILPFFATILFVSLSFSIVAQVQAGALTGMEYTSLAIFRQELSNPFGTFLQFEDDADLTGNGEADLTFVSTLANVPDFVGAMTGVDLKSAAVQVMADQDGALRLEGGDPITAAGDWQDVPPGLFAFDFIGLTGQPQVGGHWYDNSSGYLGIRVFMPTDTLYGWIDVTTAVNQQSVYLKIDGFALESVVNSVEEAEEADLRLFPNPAAGSVRLESSADKPLSKMRLFDQHGKLLLACDGLAQKSYLLERQDRPSGIYWVEVQVGERLVRRSFIWL